MRFLVITKNRNPLPPDPAMIDAVLAWVQTNKSSGKMEQSWSFAGASGGGGILNVDTLEELDTIMATFPFGQFSDITVYGLADLEQGLTGLKDHLAAIAGNM